jgi:hypothetical protein
LGGVVEESDHGQPNLVVDPQLSECDGVGPPEKPAETKNG